MNLLHKSTVLAALACGGVALACVGLATWAKSPATAAEPAGQGETDRPDPARKASIDHIKRIMLGVHNYNAMTGHLPPMAIYGDDAKPKLSWRVALLPFIGHEELFKQFHLDETWDSPHNKTLIGRMPEIFTTPSSPGAPGTTRMRGFEGPGTMFDGSRGVPIADITDGTSNTIMIFIGREAVPWTRPGELSVASDTLLKGLDDADEKGVLVGFVDGSARYVPAGDEALWRKLITRAGGEVIAWPDLAQNQLNLLPTQAAIYTTPPAVGPTTVTVTTSPGSPSPAELDQRLRMIEVKLDRVLQKLGALDEQNKNR